MEYYHRTAAEILEEQKVNPDHGLTSAQARDRLVTFGPNLIATSKRETLADIFIRQFKSPLIYILIF